MVLTVAICEADSGGLVVLGEVDMESRVANPGRCSVGCVFDFRRVVI